MLALTPAVLQMIQMGLTVLPELASVAMTEIELFRAGTPPSAEQQAAIDAALDTAHAALQAAQPGA